LSLPEEVLLQTLREEQKFFPLREITGRLLPAFIAVRNGDKAYLSAVRAGYEVVARAKLLDAQFFFEQDRQRPLADRLEDLREVVILERVGTLHDKARRLQALAGWMADELGLPAHERAMVARAALLCKADLVTAMVIEHQDLQGMMGCVYARLSGEPEPVAVAIAEHTRPRQGDGPLPATLAGSIVALCDRLDTAAACFAVGLFPAGDEDPYALRAAARGVARLLMGGNLRLSLSRLIAGALDGLAIEPAAPRDEVQAALVAFFHRHVADALMTEGISGGLARAALAAAEDTPADALARARTLQAHSAELAALQRVALRVAALGRGVEAAYDPSALTAPAEQVLAERLPALAPEAAARAARGDIEGLYALLADVTPQVERFLSANGTDDAARARARQGLAAQAAAQYRLLADFAKLDR